MPRREGASQPVAALTAFGCVYEGGGKVPHHAIRMKDGKRQYQYKHPGRMQFAPGEYITTKHALTRNIQPHLDYASICLTDP